MPSNLVLIINDGVSKERLPNVLDLVYLWSLASLVVVYVPSFPFLTLVALHLLRPLRCIRCIGWKLCLTDRGL